MTPLPCASIPADAPARPCDDREVALLVRGHVREGEPSLIHLLPALPKDWSSGHAHDLRVDGITIEIEWCNSRATRATLVADHTMTVMVRIADANPITLTLPEGEPLTLNQC